MIKLIKFEKDNIDHLNLIQELEKDENIVKNVFTILYPDCNTYVINDNNISIGIIKINKETNDYYSLDSGILSSYTNRNYGFKTLKEALKLLDKYNWNKVLLRTSHDNIPAINSGLKAGFTYDVNETEKCMEEGCYYTVLSIINQNYKKERQKIKS